MVSAMYVAVYAIVALSPRVSMPYAAGLATCACAPVNNNRNMDKRKKCFMPYRKISRYLIAGAESDSIPTHIYPPPVWISPHEHG
jgi:hypothetical protein